MLYNCALLRCYASFVGRNMAERRSCYLGSSIRHKSGKKQFEAAAELTVKNRVAYIYIYIYIYSKIGIYIYIYHPLEHY